MIDEKIKIHFKDNKTDKIVVNFKENAKQKIGLSEVIKVLDGSDFPTYTGDYDVIPNVFETQVLETKNKKMINNVTVDKIPFAKVSNEAGGETVTIGETFMMFGLSLAFEE